MKKKPARKMPKLPKLPKDIAIVQGPTEDGEGARVLRWKEGELYAGEVRPVREGQSLTQREVVRLRPLDESSPVCEVEVLHAPQEQQRERARDTGPARVTTPSYRRNWGAVFGKPSADKYSVN